MFYSRQTIKLENKVWVDIGKRLGDSEQDKVIEFEKKLEKIFGRKVITGSSMRELLALTFNYYFNKTNKSKVGISKYSHFSNLNAIILAGGTPVFLENVKTEVEKKELVGVMVAHLHGVVEDMDKWLIEAKKYNWVIFEDCAHSFGARYKSRPVGTFGVGLFSFGLGKIVTAYGGGMVCGEPDLIKYLNKKRFLKKGFVKLNIKGLLKAGIFSVVTGTLVGSWLLKLVMGILLVAKKDSWLVEKTTLAVNKNKSLGLGRLTNMQAVVGIEYLKKYQLENKLRQEKAKIYNNILKCRESKNGDIYFHYLIQTNNLSKLKWLGWKFNIDVQDDYCENIENLYNGYKGAGENRLYLPTNPEIPNKLIIDFATAAKKYAI